MRLLAGLTALAAAFAALPLPASAVVSQTEFSIAKIAQCPASTSCTVEFAPVPVNFRYKITNVSCYAIFDSPTQTVLYDQFVAFTGSDQDGRLHMHPLLLSTSAGQATYSVNEPTLIIAKAGARLISVIQGASGGAVSSYSCTISGIKTRLS